MGSFSDEGALEVSAGRDVLLDQVTRPATFLDSLAALTE